MMKQKGFTLIEMMLVIAIIGILASMAIPAYQDYIVRTRVTEGLNLASTAKLAVDEYVMSNNALPPSEAETSFERPNPTANVSAISIADANGEITIQYTKKAGDGTIVLTPTIAANQSVTWQCKAGTLSKKYRPAHCR